MFKNLKNLFVPHQPVPEVIAAQDLNNARLDLLKAQRELEYWGAMSEMLEMRVRRLTTHTQNEPKLKSTHG